jgi:hypothetical protein
MNARSATFEDVDRAKPDTTRSAQVALLAAPLLGLVAARAGLTSVYLVSALVVLASCVITLRIPRKGDVS